MRRSIILLLIVSIISLTASTSAEIPKYMQFQGKATDSDDRPLNGTYKLFFRVYNAESGGEPIWKELHDDVQIEKGVFSVLLGEKETLDLSFDKPYWISVEINTQDGTNELPRQMITSVSYAYRAKEAEYASIAQKTASINVDNSTIEEVDGQLRVKDGGITQAKLKDTSVGDVLLIASPAPKSAGNGGSGILKEIIVARNGNLRIKFTLSHTGGDGEAKGQIYKNGAPVGILHRTSGTETYTEDIDGWSVGDKCQIWGQAHTNRTCTVSDFRLYGDTATQFTISDSEL